MAPPNESSSAEVRVAEFGGVVVAGFGVAVVLLYLFAWLANEVLEQETYSLDAATLASIDRFSSPRLTLLAEGISQLGSLVIFILAGALLVVFLWQRRWGAALTLILVTAGAQVLNDLLKGLFQRTRPEPLTGLIDVQQYSFPSGHAMVAAAFYLYVAYLCWRLVRGWWRGALVAGLVLLVLLIGLARLYLGVHYLSDVIAGYLAGFVWTLAVILAGIIPAARPRRAGMSLS